MVFRYKDFSLQGLRNYGLGVRGKSQPACNKFLFFFFLTQRQGKSRTFFAAAVDVFIDASITQEGL